MCSGHYLCKATEDSHQMFGGHHRIGKEFDRDLVQFGNLLPRFHYRQLPPDWRRFQSYRPIRTIEVDVFGQEVGQSHSDNQRAKRGLRSLWLMMVPCTRHKFSGSIPEFQ